jgi:hypothetical protein
LLRSERDEIDLSLLELRQSDAHETTALDSWPSGIITPLAAGVLRHPRQALDAISGHDVTNQCRLFEQEAVPASR